MKYGTLASFLIFVFAVLITIGSCSASRKTTINQASIRSIRTGTWINHDYDEKEEPPAKAVVHSDGSYDLFAEVIDTQKTWWGQYTITEAWMDSSGTYWYEATFEESWTEAVHYELGKIDTNNTVWEFIYYRAGFPEGWEPENIRYTYRIYYRQ
jgi:hypothetical protein